MHSLSNHMTSIVIHDLAICPSLFSMATPGSHDVFTLESPIKWTRGRYPSVSVKPHGGVIVAVCIYDVTLGDAIRYAVGIISEGSDGGYITNWGQMNGTCGRGKCPSVALFGVEEKLYAIETHTSSPRWRPRLCCCVGEVKLDDKVIQWGATHSFDDGVSTHSFDGVSTHSFDDGVSPKVSTKDDGKAMIVAQSRRNTCIQLYAGTVDPKTMRFECKSSQIIPDFHGVEPDICINASKIVVTCRSDGSDILRFKIGSIGEKLSVTWNSVSCLPDHDNNMYGKYPSISLNSSGFIMEVHQTLKGRKLRHNCGRVEDDSSINWGGSEGLHFGEFPSISLCDDGFFYEVHKTRLGFHLYRMQGKLKILECLSVSYLA